MDWSPEQELEDYEEELKRREVNLKFDHLYCEKCGLCLVFKEYVPFTRAARQVGCRYGRMQIWNTPCPKCEGVMDVTSFLTSQDLLRKSCCIERNARLKRAKQIKRIYPPVLIILIGFIVFVLI